jgi:hypothetical protein
MHPVVEPPKVSKITEKPRTPMSEGVKNADLDIWMRIKGGNNGILARKIVVIHKDTNPDSPVCSLTQPEGENTSRSVGFPDIVLQIQGLFRQIGHGDTLRKRRATFAYERKTGSAGMFGGRFFEQPAKIRCVMPSYRKGGLPLDIRRKFGRAAGKHGQQQTTNNKKNSSVHGNTSVTTRRSRVFIVCRILSRHTYA